MHIHVHVRIKNEKMLKDVCLHYQSLIKGTTLVGRYENITLTQRYYDKWERHITEEENILNQ